MSHSIRWTLEKITQRLALIDNPFGPLAHRRKVELEPFKYREFPAKYSGAENNTILPGTYWGTPGTEFELETNFVVPTDWATGQSLALFLPIGDAVSFSHPEALVYIDGISYAAADRHHQEISLRLEWNHGSHRVLLRGWTGMLENSNTFKTTRLLMNQCWLVQIDQPTRDFCITARTALETARILDENHPTRHALLNVLDAAFKLLDIREPIEDAFYASIPSAHLALSEGIRLAGNPMDVTLTAAGHAHIDVAWLWTLGQTRKKAAHTFHTVLRLMEQFPAYHFTQSQPQLYKFILEDHPEVFAAIKERVRQGRWEPIGGMWVEADCNLSGPESLARQFLLGRTFFREHFGPEAESPVLWLPDVFGYAWALPQLIKQAGLDYFFTIKLGWNQYNRLPYDSFWWQGLDGTRVLTHFGTSPEDISSRYAMATYNAPATPASALGAWNNLQQKESERDVFMAFGYGDGGGGPTREMIENLSEMEQFPALPQARMGKAIDFFHKLEDHSGPNLPVWNGELYFELHRGTYTTQSRNKRANRKSEFALHDAEFLACLALSLAPDFTYPTQNLNRAWQLVCLNQFHDIIPGSSIADVYAESQHQYAEIASITGDITKMALDAIHAQVGGDILLANPTSFPRSDLAWLSVTLPDGVTLLRPDGKAVFTQAASGGFWIDVGEFSPYSVMRLHFGAESHPTPSAIAWGTSNTLENAFLRVEFSPTGDITRILDKTENREVLVPGQFANQFQAFEDRPQNWDAWDLDIFYDDKMWLADPAVSIKLSENGPLRATIEITRRILHSEYTQRISLCYNSRRLDFDTVIEWKERHVLLKTAFPVDILSPYATHEIQWGSVQRPTHRNTSWDWARFETCAHKWVDLGEGGYGVSLLNDCKYGHDIQAGTIRLSLLRSPTYPDPAADIGQHRFTYSLLPHPGGWESITQSQAYMLNDPIITYSQPATLPDTSLIHAHFEDLSPLFQTSIPGCIIETVKRAEDGNGYIIRIFESQRRRGYVSLTTAFPVDRAFQTNLLEENQQELSLDENRLTIFIKPFEIVNLRIMPGKK